MYFLTGLDNKHVYDLAVSAFHYSNFNIRGDIAGSICEPATLWR